MTDDRFLPYGRQAIGDDDINAVQEVLRSDYLTTGPTIGAFENAFARTVGSQAAVCCANGTAALHLAVLAAGIGPGDTCVVPSITFVATANAVRFSGAEVVFSDVDPSTGLMTEQNLRDAINNSANNVKAVLPVHYAGMVAPLDKLLKVSESHNATIIEDSCHALGSIWEDEQGDLNCAGSATHSTMATFSFHPVKSIACGEGGMIATNDLDVADRLRKLRSHGIERNPSNFADESNAEAPWYHEMHDLGYNYRLSAIHAALGISQLAKIEQFIRKREELIEFYNTKLQQYQPYIQLVTQPRPHRTSWHLAVVQIDFERLKTDRATLMRRMYARKIGTQVHYIPVHTQPYYKKIVGKQTLPGAEYFYSRSLSLPLFIGMNEEDVDRVVWVLSESLGL